MTVPALYQAKNNWPHTFTRTGKQTQIGTNDDTGMPIYAQEMICTHCHITYMNQMQPKPVGACPARNDRKEYKRLGVDNPNDTVHH